MTHIANFGLFAVTQVLIFNRESYYVQVLYSRDHGVLFIDWVILFVGVLLYLRSQSAYQMDWYDSEFLHQVQFANAFLPFLSNVLPALASTDRMVEPECLEFLFSFLYLLSGLVNVGYYLRDSDWCRFLILSLLTPTLGTFWLVRPAGRQDLGSPYMKVYLFLGHLLNGVCVTLSHIPLLFTQLPSENKNKID